MSDTNWSGDPPEAFGPTHTATFEPDEDASAAVVLAVSEASGVDSVALSPLYDVVEPDALDTLVAHARHTETPARHRLGFTYEGYDVLVRGDGFVVLEALPDGTTASAATALDSE